MNETETIRVLNEFRKTYRGRLDGRVLDRLSWGNMDNDLRQAVMALIDVAQSDAFNYVITSQGRKG